MSTRYKVVINHEEQYSLIKEGERLPRGWQDTGFKGDGARVLAYIEEVWTDMRPMQKRALEQIVRRG